MSSMDLTEEKCVCQETKKIQAGSQEKKFLKSVLVGKKSKKKSGLPEESRYSAKPKLDENDFRVVDAKRKKEKGEDCEFGFKTFLLSFPIGSGSLWRLSRSPFAKSLEFETLEWLKKRGLLPTQKLVERVQAMEISGYGGFSHPFRNFEYSLSFTKYITLWLLWDDVCVEKSREMKDFETVLDAISGHEVKSQDLFVLAWKEVCDEYTRLGASKEFRKRLGRNMHQWIEFALREVRLQNTFKSVPFRTLCYQRWITIGMIPAAQLLERSCGIELGKLSETAVLKELVLGSAKIVAVANELLSVPKDHESGWVNLALAYKSQKGCSIEKTYSTLVKIHECAVLNFDECERKLLKSLGKDSEKVKVWIACLRECARGFSHWHTVCRRYMSKRVLDKKLGKVLIVK